AADVWTGRRLSGTALASYTAQLGSVAVSRVPSAGGTPYPLTTAFPGTYSAGNVLQLAINPRYRLAGYFALTGMYSLLHVGADQYTLGAVAPNTALPTIASFLDSPPGSPYGMAASTAHQIGLGF